MKYIYTCQRCGVETVSEDPFLRCPVCGSGEFTYKPYVPSPQAHQNREGYDIYHFDAGEFI